MPGGDVNGFLLHYYTISPPATGCASLYAANVAQRGSIHPCYKLGLTSTH